MKVIHYIASVDKSGGGTTEYMRLLSNALKNDTSFSIATGFSKDPITIEGVPIKFFNSNVFRWFSLINEYRTFLENEKPDIVHINGIWSPQNWGFQKAAQELKIKVVMSPHGMLESWILQRNPLKKKIALFLFQNNAIKKADHIHATAQMEKDSVRKLSFDNPISIIPNGIDLSELKRGKEQYGTQKMVFLSRIHPKKGIEILLEAWSNCDTKGWTLEIAGSGDTAYIATLIQSAQTLKNVHFVGAKYGEDKWNFLRSADVMVLPTHSENFGIVVAEALAVGVPVITTTGTPWQDLENYNCGWWIDLSVVNLKSVLLKVFNTPAATLEKMGKNGKNLVQEKYDIKAIGKKMVQLYNFI
ncbi:glycosyltransferase [Flavobacterium aquicola]|uniref:Glycosyltransferase involved in cell wall biosynthesis n=1 Tax=Flavobacterium aquicola TaxID=1682742 RepID=A0A3E0EUU0_9FLAO|nr:glycosyltransferase [Flavobacterium aquicola]REH01899.1 glycosyltransferase involved in cell wall biosynthesis [Flavobacterium aquicola]